MAAEQEIRADERRKTAQYIAGRLEEMASTESNDARRAAFAYAAIIARVHAEPAGGAK